MRFPRAVHVLAWTATLNVVCSALEYPFIGSFDDDDNCSHLNKQIALYLDYDFGEPLIKIEPTALRVKTSWVNVTDIRAYGKNGVFAAHPFHTVDGPGGYFGSQVDGNVTGDSGGLLFSIWDLKDPKEPCNYSAPNETWCLYKHAFPVSSTCDRHCLDCGLHPGWTNTTGTQCHVQLNVTDGDKILWDIRQSEVNSSYAFGNVTLNGSEWTVTAQYTARGQATRNITVGQVFFERSWRGLKKYVQAHASCLSLNVSMHSLVDSCAVWKLVSPCGTNVPATVPATAFAHSLGAFHEHIGCTECDAFYESEIRTGPWVLQPRPHTVKNINFTRVNASCQLFDFRRLHSDSVLIETGPGTGPDLLSVGDVPTAA